MCGLCGILSPGKFTEEQKDELQRMSSALEHRGPDDSGTWFDLDSGIGLAHQRLSILDLSTSGRQPMLSASRRFVIAFNGEIYNYLELSKELRDEGCSAIHGESDTSVLIAAFDFWGIQKTLARLIGMFAIALWDREESKLYLIRDRMGEKPLYYGYINGEFVFSSELSSFQARSNFPLSVDRDALALFMRYLYVPAPYSIYKGINKLEPGKILTCSIDDAQRVSFKQETYWDVSQFLVDDESQNAQYDKSQTIDAYNDLLRQAVKSQMRSDVPLGAFLSGGIDSSTIVALMQESSQQKVKTYSIGFNDPAFNEAAYAKDVATHLGTEHTELYIDKQALLDIVPQLPDVYSEPFADISQIPTYLVCKLARSEVTVALSGDGADEIFGGYTRYNKAIGAWQKMQRHKMLSGMLGPVVSAGQRYLPDKAWAAKSRLRKLSDGWLNDDFLGLYRHRESLHKVPELMVLGASASFQNKEWQIIKTSDRDQRTIMSHFDLMRYLPDDVLVKIDRASMSVGLEARAPFLDRRVVEAVAGLPWELKVQPGQPKWLLRQILYRYVDRSLVDRPKMGFGAPVGAWLRNELQDWAATLLDSQRLHQEGYFNVAMVEALWQEHLSGKKDRGKMLWPVLMFQSWLDAQSQSSL